MKLERIYALPANEPIKFRTLPSGKVIWEDEKGIERSVQWKYTKKVTFIPRDES